MKQIDAMDYWYEPQTPNEFGLQNLNQVRRELTEKQIANRQARRRMARNSRKSNRTK